MNAKRARRLEDFRPPIKLKLSALWTSVMFLYVYGDYFNMYTAGELDAMAAGDLGIGKATEMALVGVAVMMAVPALMIFLSLALPPAINRWLNFAFGVAYTAILALTLPGAPLFYIVYGAIEMTLTLFIAALALFWPEAAPTA
jgi:hypothetical protein